MERKDLLAANVKIFKSQGKALDQYAKKDVKVLNIVHLFENYCVLFNEERENVYTKFLISIFRF